MVSNPAISVVLPAFNAQEFVGQSVDSILKQDFADWELIVVDDGSSDGTLNVIRNRARLDSRIKVVSRENKGLVYSLNEGIDLARGKWIARMDADDIARPQRFSSQLRELSDTGAQVCGSAFRTFGAVWPRVRRHEQTDKALKLQLLFDTCVAHPSVVMEAQWAKKHRYDDAAKFIEDYDLWVRMALAGACFCNVKDVLLDYRIHAKQITANFKIDQIAARIRIAQKYRVESGLGLEIGPVHEFLLGRGRMSSEQLIACVDALQQLAVTSGNPEGVVQQNLMQFLGRHSGMGCGLMHTLLRRCELSAYQQSVLLGISALRPSPNSQLMAWLKKFR